MSTPDAAPAAAPECPRHPGTVAYVRCQRCNRPTCPACQVPAPVGVLCVDCVRQANAAARPVRSGLGFTPAHGTPWVTYVLIALNVAVYVAAQVKWGGNWVSWLGLWPHWTLEAAPYIGAGDEWYRWVTSGFVHFGLLHVGMNMFVLWQFGSQLEPALGRWRIGALYGASLLGSSLVVALMGAPGSVHGGASGAIFGLIAAFVVVLRTLRLEWRQTAMFAGAWLVLGFFVSGLSWQGHLGGAIAGALVMALMLRSVSRRRSGR